MAPLPEPPARFHISLQLVEDLRSSLETSQLLTPEADAYQIKIKRWAESSEKKAVRSH